VQDRDVGGVPYEIGCRATYDEIVVQIVHTRLDAEFVCTSSLARFRANEIDIEAVV
jgi:hypothetical protein